FFDREGEGPRLIIREPNTRIVSGRRSLALPGDRWVLTIGCSRQFQRGNKIFYRRRALRRESSSEKQLRRISAASEAEIKTGGCDLCATAGGGRECGRAGGRVQSRAGGGRRRSTRAP